MEINLKIGGKSYHIPRVTLGDMVLLKQHFGLQHMSQLETGADDPQVIAGFVYLAYKQAHPEWEHERVLNETLDVDLDDLTDEAAAEPAPATDADPNPDAGE